MRTFLPVRLGDLWLALGAAEVQEVLGARPWLPIPGASGGVPGVLSWRGRAIAVVDLGVVTGAAAPLRPDETRPRIVVLRLGTTTLALPVEGVREVIEVPAEAVRPSHVTRPRCSTTEVELAGTVAAIVDAAALLAAVAPAAS
ncbi:MAG TPA: chemotaxis protein CheW [Polyangia bacterium]|jgi:chemotaxis signal transduction protein